MPAIANLGSADKPLLVVVRIICPLFQANIWMNRQSFDYAFCRLRIMLNGSLNLSTGLVKGFFLQGFFLQTPLAATAATSMRRAGMSARGCDEEGRSIPRCPWLRPFPHRPP